MGRRIAGFNRKYGLIKKEKTKCLQESIQLNF